MKEEVVVHLVLKLDLLMLPYCFVTAIRRVMAAPDLDSSNHSWGVLEATLTDLPLEGPFLNVILWESSRLRQLLLSLICTCIRLFLHLHGLESLCIRQLLREQFVFPVGQVITTILLDGFGVSSYQLQVLSRLLYAFHIKNIERNKTLPGCPTAARMSVIHHVPRLNSPNK